MPGFWAIASRITMEIEEDLVGREFSQWCCVVSMETGITTCDRVASETGLRAEHRTTGSSSHLGSVTAGGDDGVLEDPSTQPVPAFAMVLQVPGRLWAWCVQWPPRLHLCV